MGRSKFRGLMKRVHAFLCFAFAALLMDFAPVPEEVPPDQRAAEIVRVTVEPVSEFTFAVMKPGVRQHIDRDYTYDVVPEEIAGGLLFQGIHRAPTGTKIRFELLQPASVYVFFHDVRDGGWEDLFSELPEWKRCLEAPQYDVHNGDHGLRMIMYQLDALPGSYSLPATVKDRACFNLVIRPLVAANPQSSGFAGQLHLVR